MNSATLTSASSSATAGPTGRSTIHRLAVRTAYPAVLVGNVAALLWAAQDSDRLGAFALPGLLVSLLVLCVLERLLPHKASWHPDAREGLRDFFYFGMNGGLDALGKLAVALCVSTAGTWHNGLPVWLALPLAVLVVDFAGYWLHRLGHSGWLWKVHGVHHTPDKVNTWNNNTIHFINTLYSGLSKSLPLWALGFSADIIVVAAYLSTLWSFAVHANIDVEMAGLDRFLMSPVHHRLHHSTQIEEAGNFASVTTLWDRVCGTFVYGPGRVPAAGGVQEPLAFPQPNEILRNQLHPFVPSP